MKVGKVHSLLFNRTRALNALNVAEHFMFAEIPEYKLRLQMAEDAIVQFRAYESGERRLGDAKSGFTAYRMGLMP